MTFNQTPIPNPLPTGITFTPPSTIGIATAGVYDVKFYAIPQDANITFALMLNNNEVLGTRYTDTSSAGNLTGQALVVVNQNNVPATLSLRNVDPQQTANIDNGQLNNTVSASILIEKIS